MTNNIDFGAAFEAIPGNNIFIQVDPPKYTILAATESYTIATGVSKDELIGRGVFEAFPSNPDDANDTGGEDLLNSFEKVITYKTAHQLPVQRYDVADDKGNFVQKFWRVSNSPCFGQTRACSLHC